MRSDSDPTRVRRGEVFIAECPSRQVLKHVSSQWGLLALIALRDGRHRFSGLRRRLSGVSEKMLAQTLQNLEADGFVVREAFPEVPPRVEYELSPMGHEVARRVHELVDWIEQQLPDILQQQAQRAVV